MQANLQMGNDMTGTYKEKRPGQNGRWQYFRAIGASLFLTMPVFLGSMAGAQETAPAAAPVVVAPVPTGPVQGSEPGVAPLPEPDPYLDREKGIRALDLGDYQAAAAFFSKYRTATQKREPDFSDATMLICKAYLRAREPGKALECLAVYNAETTGQSDVYYRAGLAYLKGAALRDSGKPQAAIEAATPATAEQIDPEFRSLALQVIGDSYVMLRQWGPAEQTFTRLLAEFPNAANAGEVRLALMKVLLASGQGDKAARCLAELARTQTDLPKLLLARYAVHVHMLNGDLDAAYQAYEQIAGERPRQPDADWWIMTSQLAAALLRAGEVEKALVVLPHAAGLAMTEDDRVECLLRMAEAQIRLKNANLAIDALETFRKEYPHRQEVVPVLIKLAELLRSTENYMTAAEYFGQISANEQAPVGFRYRSAISRGWCFRDAGQFEKAVEAFASGEALGTSPEQKANAVFLAGESAFQIKSYAVAAEYYGRVADVYADSSMAETARFRQGRSLFSLRSYASAAAVYSTFLQTFPNSQSAEQAELERGISLRFAATTPMDFSAALQALADFVRKYPASASAPQACLEGYEAALGAEKPAEASAMLTRVIDNYTDSELVPHALYHRARLHFSLGENEAALQDSTRFLDRFPLLPLAPDILIWVGDYYANTQQYAEAKGYYLRLVTTHPVSSLVPAALYEASLCDYRLDNLDGALALADKLEGTTEPPPDPLVLAKGHMLHGDMLAKLGQYNDAIPHFSKARELAGDLPLGLSALGRRGDMFLSRPGAKQENIQEALDCFAAIIANPKTPPDLLEIARYRTGKCYEALGNNDQAIEAYLSVYYEYEHDLANGIVRDWFYYVRSAYDAARLYELNGQKGKLRLAARLYERLSRSGVPGAEDAKRRADEIRNAHGMAD